MINVFNQLSSVHQYLLDTNSLLNPAKTKYLTFKSRKIQGSTTMNANSLINEHVFVEEVQKIKYTVVNNNLSRTFHIDFVCDKIASKLFPFRNISNFYILQAMKSVSFALIHSHISFGLVVYRNTFVGNIHTHVRKL